jgi:transitional endoplasmic reticulum ATPase
VNFVQLKASDVFSKWYGESERLLREAFAKARALVPCVLFLDQVDALAPKRAMSSAAAQDESGVGARVLSTLLNELDGIDSRRDGLIVLAATNRIEAMDDAALRPGRLGGLVYVGPPDANDARLLLRELCAPIVDPRGAEEVLRQLDPACRTGAEIKAWVSAACFGALRRNALHVELEDFESHWHGDNDQDEDDEESL